MEDKKQIPHFERYAIHKEGYVVNLKTERILKPDLISKGYYAVTMCYNGNKKREYIHRLVANAFVANPSNKPFVNHKNGIRTDNSWVNLEWVTPKENIRHAYKIGLCPTSLKALQGGKLSEADVIKIRSLLKNGSSGVEIARLYNLHPVSVTNIKRRKTWKHI